MKRKSIITLIDDFNKSKEIQKQNFPFYISDIDEIVSISSNYYELVFKLLEAGYMAGFNAGKRSARK